MKLLAIATAAAVFAAGAAFAQTSQPPGQQPNAKGGQMEDQNKQTSSGAAKTGTTNKTGTTKSGAAMKNEGTAGSSGTTGMKNDGASSDSKTGGGAPNKASEQGNK